MNNANQNYFETALNHANLMYRVDTKDYDGDDGLTLCGNCHTRRQKRQTFMGKEYIVPVMCRCREEKEKEQQQIDLIEWLEKTRKQQLPDENYRRMTFENSDYDLKVARKYVENWECMYDDNIGLLFYGNAGTGKTYSAAAIANAILDKYISVERTFETAKKYRVYMNNMPSLVAMMNDTYGEGYVECMRLMADSALVVIDDEGAERDTPTANEKAFQIIEKRIESKKPMIVTTNLDIADINTKSMTGNMHERRIYSRLLSLTPVKFTGDDRRKTDMKSRYKDIKNLLGIENG